jgi:hypothetical protein
MMPVIVAVALVDRIDKMNKIDNFGWKVVSAQDPINAVDLVNPVQ